MDEVTIGKERGNVRDGEPNPLETFDKIRLEGAPFDKRTLVLGSGPNTEFWKNASVETLDIDPAYGADFEGDANVLTEVLKGEKFDIIIAENIRFDPNKETGVNLEALVNGIHETLAPGGEMIIYTAESKSLLREEPDGTLPLIPEWCDAAVAAGFNEIGYQTSGTIIFPENPRPKGDNIVIDDVILQSRLGFSGKKGTPPEPVTSLQA